MEISNKLKAFSFFIPSEKEWLVQDGDIEHGCHNLNQRAKCCCEHWPSFLNAPWHSHKTYPWSNHSLHIHNGVIYYITLLHLNFISTLFLFLWLSFFYFLIFIPDRSSSELSSYEQVSKNLTPCVFLWKKEMKSDPSSFLL